MNKFKNINSSINIKRDFIESAIARLTFLTKAYADISQIEFVNEQTMDQICPPRKGYDPECTSQVLKKIKEESENYEDNYEKLPEIVESLFRRLNDCKGVLYVAIGCYSKQDNKIYICPERVYKYKSPEIIFQKVLIHELVHAYLKTGDLNDDEMIIEESLANAIAFIHFDKEKTIISEFIKRQPLEYQGYYYWLKYGVNYLPFILDNWKDKFKYYPWFFYYYIDEIYFLRRFIILYPYLLYPFFHFRIPWRLAEALAKYYEKTRDLKPFLKLLAMSILESAI